MADNNFFFKVLAELGYFKCFYILFFFPLRGGGLRPLVENSTNFIFFIFETLPKENKPIIIIIIIIEKVKTQFPLQIISAKSK